MNKGSVTCYTTNKRAVQHVKREGMSEHPVDKGGAPTGRQKSTLSRRQKASADGVTAVNSVGPIDHHVQLRGPRRFSSHLPPSRYEYGTAPKSSAVPPRISLQPPKSLRVLLPLTGEAAWKTAPLNPQYDPTPHPQTPGARA